MKAHRICPAAELKPGERKIVEIGGRSIGVFNVHGSYYAIRNVCPHQLAPLCEGKITGTTEPGRPGEYHWVRQGEIVRCPWHGWEFDITTGQSVFNPHKLRVKKYEVAVVSSQEKPTCDEGDTSPTCAGNIDATEVETFEVKVEEAWVMLYV